MNTLKKIISMMLCLAVICCYLTSCDTEEKDTQTDTYAVDVKITFATNDEKMKEAAYAASSSAVIEVDKEKLSVRTLAETDNTSVTNVYTYIDNILYRDLTVSVGEHTVNSLKKANMSEIDRDALLSDIGAGASVGVGDFLTPEITTSSDRTIYTCSDINDQAKESLCGIFASKFEGLDAVVTLKNAYYTLETVGERNDNSVLSCNFVIVMNGESYEITMHIYSDYDYEAEVSISAPSDADKYATVSYMEITE